MSIGETLATARAEAGLAVEDVSRETRIRSTLIRAIERDDFSLCGGDVYARGHIRNIANYVGVDPRPLIAEFDGLRGTPTPVESPVPAFDPEVAARSERGRPNWAAAMAVALAVISLIAGIQLATHNGSGKPTTERAGHVQPSVPAPEQSVAPTPGPAPSGAVALVPRQGVHVQVRIVGAGARSWVHVAGSGGVTLFEGILDDTSPTKNFSDPHVINMTVGNAGVVELVVNGHDRGLAGTSGEVIHRTFHPAPCTAGAG